MYAPERTGLSQKVSKNMFRYQVAVVRAKPFRSAMARDVSVPKSFIITNPGDDFLQGLLTREHFIMKATGISFV